MFGGNSLPCKIFNLKDLINLAKNDKYLIEFCQTCSSFGFFNKDTDKIFGYPDEIDKLTVLYEKLKEKAISQ